MVQKSTISTKKCSTRYGTAQSSGQNNEFLGRNKIKSGRIRNSSEQNNKNLLA